MGLFSRRRDLPAGAVPESIAGLQDSASPKSSMPDEATGVSRSHGSPDHSDVPERASQSSSQPPVVTDADHNGDSQILFTQAPTGAGPAVVARDHSIPHGPYDVSDHPEVGPVVDLGAVRVPAVDGLQLRLENTTQTPANDAVVLMLGGSSLELRAFAAPKSSGLWDGLTEEICAELDRVGGTHAVEQGPHGHEVLATMPVQLPNGERGTAHMRFIGVDGPRWFLRGVLNGPAALDWEASQPLRDVFNHVVVVRGQDPKPPRELLLLYPPTPQKTTDRDPRQAAAS